MALSWSMATSRKAPSLSPTHSVRPLIMAEGRVGLNTMACNRRGGGLGAGGSLLGDTLATAFASVAAGGLLGAGAGVATFGNGGAGAGWFAAGAAGAEISLAATTACGAGSADLLASLFRAQGQTATTAGTTQSRRRGARCPGSTGLNCKTFPGGGWERCWACFARFSASLIKLIRRFALRVPGQRGESCESQSAPAGRRTPPGALCRKSHSTAAECPGCSDRHAIRPIE